jgi:hypothetical protein
MFDDITNQSFTIVFDPSHDGTRADYAGRQVTVVDHGKSFMPEVRDDHGMTYRIRRAHLQPA